MSLLDISKGCCPSKSAPFGLQKGMHLSSAVVPLFEAKSWATMTVQNFVIFADIAMFANFLQSIAISEFNQVHLYKA